MKFHLDLPDGRNRIVRYGPGEVVINLQAYRSSLVVMPERIIADWGGASDMPFAAADFEAIAELQPELVLVGTGRQLLWPPAEAFRPLIEAGIGYEVMDTGAACRTYNILMGEGRSVAAALRMIAPAVE
jgi:uncharacterized protein